jgi:hypothetical protein
MSEPQISHNNYVEHIMYSSQVQLTCTISLPTVSTLCLVTIRPYLMCVCVCGLLNELSLLPLSLLLTHCSKFNIQGLSCAQCSEIRITANPDKTQSFILLFSTTCFSLKGHHQFEYKNKRIYTHSSHGTEVLEPHSLYTTWVFYFCV